MARKTGRFAIIEQLLADGITYMFGNPGTVEQGFLDALGDVPRAARTSRRCRRRSRSAMADGYARATAAARRSCSCTAASGSATASGCSTRRSAGDAPLVVIAGESGVRYDAMDAQMAADLVAMARAGDEVGDARRRPDSLLRVLRRAIKIAATPPTGPVFVALPMDVLDAPSDEEVVPTTRPRHARRADRGARSPGAAELLAGGPAADRRSSATASRCSGAQAELTRVAELLGAEVWGANSSEVNIDAPTTRCSAASSGTCSASTARRSRSRGRRGADRAAPTSSPRSSRRSRASSRRAPRSCTSTSTPTRSRKNFPVDLGLVADPKTHARRCSADELERTLTRRAARRGRARTSELGAQKQQELDAARGARPRVRRRHADAPVDASWRSSRGRCPTTS